MPGHETTTTPTGSGSGSGSAGTGTPNAAGDVSFDVPTSEVKGVIFEPQAIYAPAMMLIYSKKKITLDKQRDVFAKTKDPVQKEAQGAVLATMLYDKSKTEKDDAAKAKWWGEALQALKDAAAVSGAGKEDEITLALIGRYALLLNDYATAEQAFGGLVTRFPKVNPAENKAWYAYSLLEEHKNPEALEVVKAETPNEKQPELAYVTAWAKFRALDGQGAFAAIIPAVKGLGATAPRGALDRDMYLFAGRTGVSLDDAVAALGPLVGKAPANQFDLLAGKLREEYEFAGRWSDAIAAIDKGIAAAGSQLPPEDLPKLRLTQANFAVRLDDPAKVAQLSKDAIDALKGCGAKCDAKAQQDLGDAVEGYAKLLYVIYATAHDDRYYQPAHDLFLASMPLISANPQLTTSAQKDATDLEAFKKNFEKKPNEGTHSKDLIPELLKLHLQEVQACYELALAQNPKIGGTLVLHIEADQTGAIKGASTDPKAGMQDLAEVAGCVVERAKTWRLPKIANGTGSHHTRIKLTYSLAPRARATNAPTTPVGSTPPAQPAPTAAKK